MSKGLKKVINFGYKVSEGDHDGFACFLKHLKPSEHYEDNWRDLVVDVIAELPIKNSKQVLRAMLKDSVH